MTRYYFLSQMSALGETEEDAVFKFEPFILHVQCCSLEDARLMVTLSLMLVEAFLSTFSS